MTDLTLDLAGEEVALLPERALFWPRSRTLFIADTHFGKAATFRAAAIPIPGGTTQRDLDRLTRVVQRTAPRRLVILGDLLHARSGRSDGVLDAVSAWRREFARLEIVLVRGNHDRHAGPPPDEWHMTTVEGPVVDAPFILQHEPEPSDAGYVLAGHLHPAIRLRGLARQNLKLPCFHLASRVATLPAFCSFVDGLTIHPEPPDRIFGIAADRVIECPVR